MTTQEVHDVYKEVSHDINVFLDKQQGTLGVHRAIPEEKIQEIIFEALKKRIV